MQSQLVRSAQVVVTCFSFATDQSQIIVLTFASFLSSEDFSTFFVSALKKRFLVDLLFIVLRIHHLSNVNGYNSILHLTHVQLSCKQQSCLYPGGPCSGPQLAAWMVNQAFPGSVHQERAGMHGFTYNPMIPGPPFLSFFGS